MALQLRREAMHLQGADSTVGIMVVLITLPPMWE